MMMERRKRFERDVTAEWLGASRVASRRAVRTAALAAVEEP